MTGVFEGSGVYLLAAFVVTLAVLAGYWWSLQSRAREARREPERQDSRSPRRPGPSQRDL